MKVTLKLKVGVVVAISLLGIMWFSVYLARADNGPHGGYSASTDICAGCHRAHTAITNNLLVTPVPDLCYTCHGTTAAGADTNVVDGIYDGLESGAGEGDVGWGLKGGGMVNALMDTDWDMDPADGSASVSSSHLVDGSTGTAWGSGVKGSGPGLEDFNLSCVSCHDPHGGASSTGGPTYRLLRALPVGSGAGSGANVTDEGSKKYTVSNSDNQYFTQSYGGRMSQLSNWCAQCHTRYSAPIGSGRTDYGDPIFAFRHMTTGAIVGCMSCHVAHGTSAIMGSYSGSVKWPDNSTTPGGNNRSSLLRVDNRGVCELCHDLTPD